MLGSKSDKRVADRIDGNKCRLHWYSLSFVGESIDGGSSITYGSAYKGFDQKDKISVNDIGVARLTANLSDNSTLISVSYLGHMTKKELGV